MEFFETKKKVPRRGMRGILFGVVKLRVYVLRVPKLTDWGLWYSDCGALVMLKKECFDGTNGPQSFHKTVSQ